MLTQEQLKDRLHYDLETGVFTYKISPVGSVAVGAIAGSLSNKGYRNININYQEYKAHRLAWFYVYGVWPQEQLDHINGIKDDNRLCNLREATQGQNQQNSAVYANNKCGIKGIFWNKYNGKWRAQIRYRGKQRHIGYFDTAEEAGERYKAFAEAIHKEFLHHSLKE